MSTELTPQQHAELEQHGHKPMPVVDPVDQKVYFLVPGDIYERFKAFLNDESFDVRETYAAQSQVAGAAGWDDPEMALYDNYDAHKTKS